MTAGIGDAIEKKYAQIWVWHEGYPKAQLYFGIESFNGTGNYGGDLFIGVFNPGPEANEYTNEFGTAPARHWYEEKFLEFKAFELTFAMMQP